MQEEPASMLMTVAQSIRFRKASLALAAATAELRTCMEQADAIAARQEAALHEFRAIITEATGINIELGLMHRPDPVPA
jgi:hypothetical protein